VSPPYISTLIVKYLGIAANVTPSVIKLTRKRVSFVFYKITVGNKVAYVFKAELPF